MLSEAGRAERTEVGSRGEYSDRGGAPKRNAGAAQSFAAINGLRGPGALAIAFAHFGLASDAIAIRHVEPIALLVDLFFVLSGLVIAQAYSEKLTRPSAIPEYVIRRFGRIWPVQVATLAILVAYELLKFALHKASGGHFSSAPFDPDGINLVQAIPTNLLLIQSLGFHDRETWNFPSWSLSVELVTYVLFAGFCLLRPLWRRALALLTIVLSIAILVFVAPYHMRSTFDYGIFRCLSGFFVGTLCQEIIVRRRLPSPAMPMLAEIVAVAMVGVWLSCAVGTNAVFAAPFVFGAFVLVFAGGRGGVSRLLASKPLQTLAEWSFSIYMVHALVLIFFLAGAHELARLSGHPLFVSIANPIADHPGARPIIEVLHFGSTPLMLGVAFLYGCAVIFAAWLAFRCVEIPGRSLFGKLARHVDVSRKTEKRQSPRTAAETVP